MKKIAFIAALALILTFVFAACSCEFSIGKKSEETTLATVPTDFPSDEDAPVSEDFDAAAALSGEALKN